MTCARATSVLCSFWVVRLRECGDVLRAYSPTPPARRRRDVLCMCKWYLYTSRRVLAAARAAARRRFVRGGREVAGEEPEVL